MGPKMEGAGSVCSVFPAKGLHSDGEWRIQEAIVPVTVKKTKKLETVVDTNEGPCPETTAEILVHLKPAFKTGGKVTVTNFSEINGSAAALLLMSEEKARDWN